MMALPVLLLNIASLHTAQRNWDNLPIHYQKASNLHIRACLEQYTRTTKPKSANFGMRPESANGVKPVASTMMSRKREGSSTPFLTCQRASLFHQCQKSWKKIKKRSSSPTTISIGVTIINNPEETLNAITTSTTITPTTFNNNTWCPSK